MMTVSMPDRRSRKRNARAASGGFFPVSGTWHTDDPVNCLVPAVSWKTVIQLPLLILLASFSTQAAALEYDVACTQTNIFGGNIINFGTFTFGQEREDYLSILIECNLEDISGSGPITDTVSWNLRSGPSIGVHTSDVLRRAMYKVEDDVRQEGLLPFQLRLSNIGNAIWGGIGREDSDGIFQDSGMITVTRTGQLEFPSTQITAILPAIASAQNLPGGVGMYRSTFISALRWTCSGCRKATEQRRAEIYTVMAEFEGSCSFSMPSMQFGPYRNERIVMEKILQINCTPGTDYEISFSPGSSSDNRDRSMENTRSGIEDVLKYNLYEIGLLNDCSEANPILGDGSSGTEKIGPVFSTLENGQVVNVITDDTGTRQSSIRVCGIMPSNQLPLAPGNYRDTIVVEMLPL